MFEWTAMMVLALIGGCLVGLVVRYFLFRIGCILADVADPALGKSILLVVVVAGATLPLGGWVGVQLLNLEKGLAGSSGLLFYPGLVLYGVLAWFAAATGYSLVLAASYKKSLIIAGVELLLSALLIALVTALVLVGLAGWQIARRAPAQSQLRPDIPWRAAAPCTPSPFPHT